MAVSTAVEEALQEFQTKQKFLFEVMELAKDGQKHDLGRKAVLEKLGVPDRSAALDRVKALNRELDELGDTLAQAELKAVEESAIERDRQRKEPVRGGEAVHALPEDNRVKTLGERFIETKQYKMYRETRQPQTAEVEIGLKTLFERSAGFEPEAVRSGLIVPAVAFSHAELLDIIPVFPIQQSHFKYMEETTRTHAAEEKAEGVAYPESTFEFTEKSSEVQKIPDSIPVTDEQLEDEGQVASLLDQRLRFGVRRRLASQLLNGNGTPPNLRGILNVVGIGSQAKGADSIMAAAYKALTKVRFTGQAEPTAFVFHPNDWQTVVLGQESTGGFIWGHPSAGPVTMLWGLPVALSTAITEGSALTGDFRNFARLDERRGVTVEVGFVGQQFLEGKRTLRAQMRAAFTVTRPAAFCEITGL